MSDPKDKAPELAGGGGFEGQGKANRTKFADLMRQAQALYAHAKDLGNVVGVLVEHDAFCPMAYGEGSECASACRPVVKLMPVETLAERVSRDRKNRAQRRAEARASGKGGQP